MRLADFKIEELIESLRGTCQTLSEALPEGMEEDDLTKADTDAIDEQIFRCETCSWWDEISEQNEDGENCLDCVPEDPEV